MTSAEFYTSFRRLINEPITGNVTEADVEDYYNTSQIEHASWLVGKKQGYSRGFPEPPVHLAATLDVASSLACLRKVVSLEVKNGLAAFTAADLFHGPVDVSIYGAGSKCQGEINVSELIPLTQLNDDEWSYRTKSYIDRPSLKNPVWGFHDSGNYKISPNNIQYVYVTYYKNPPKISISGGVNPVWLDGDIMIIMWRALQRAGLNLTDEMAMQFGYQKERSDS